MTLNLLFADSDSDREADALRNILNYTVMHVETSEEAEQEMGKATYHGFIIEPYRPRLEWNPKIHAARFISHVARDLDLPVIIYTSEGQGRLMAYLELMTGVDYALLIPKLTEPPKFCQDVSEAIKFWNDTASLRKTFRVPARD